MTSAEGTALAQDGAEDRGNTGIRATATLLVHDGPGALASQDLAEVANLLGYVNVLGRHLPV